MEKDMKRILITFIMIVVLTALSISVFSNTSKNTQYQAIYNDPIQLATTSNLSLRGHTITNLVVWNATNGTVKTNYNLTIVEGGGIVPAYLALNDTTWKNTPLLINYSYYDVMYINDSTSRNLISIISILTAMGILGVVIYYNKDIFEDWF